MTARHRPRLGRALTIALAAVFGCALVGLPSAFASAAPELPTLSAAPPAAASTDPVTASESIGVWVRLDSNKSPVSGVSVTVSNNSGFTATVQTGPNGRVEIGVPETGDYSVTLDESKIPAGNGMPKSGSNPRAVHIDKGNKGVPAYFNLAAGAPSGDTPTGSDSTTPPAPGRSANNSGTSFIDVLLPRLATGLLFGLLLALASIGVSLIFGTTGLNNFAHGELVTFGGLVAYVLTVTMALPGWVGVIGALVLGGAFGYVQDLGLWRPLRKRGISLIPLMIVSVGLSLVLRYLFQVVFGPASLVLPADNTAAITWGPVHFRSSDAIGAVICIVLVAAVAFVLLRTRIGKATRAVSDNKALAAASGIHVERVIRLVWIGGGALAGIAGALIAFYQTISWNTGASILLLIFAAVTLGGLGTAFGALVGSLIIGLFIEVSTIWLPANLKYAAALGVMILILLVRPQGILGKRDRIG